MQIKRIKRLSYFPPELCKVDVTAENDDEDRGLFAGAMSYNANTNAGSFFPRRRNRDRRRRADAHVRRG